MNEIGSYKNFYLVSDNFGNFFAYENLDDFLSDDFLISDSIENLKNVIDSL